MTDAGKGRKTETSIRGFRSIEAIGQLLDGSKLDMLWNQHHSSSVLRAEPMIATTVTCCRPCSARGNAYGEL